MDTVIEEQTLVERAPGVARLDVWASIAGVVVALAIQMVLIVLGAAIGLTAFEPESGVAKGVGIGFLAWLLISLCASAFIGAWLASAFARTPRARDGLLHGLVLWAAVSLIGAMFVGGAVKGMLSGIFGVIGAGTQAAATAMKQQPPAEQAQAPQAGAIPTEPGAIQQKVGGAVESARDAFAQPETRQRVAEKADAASAGAAIGMWGVFAALILPLCAALFGGWAGARREARMYRVPLTARRRRVDDRPLGTPPVPAT